MFTYKTGMKIQHVDHFTNKPLDIHEVKEVVQEPMELEVDETFSTAITVEVIVTTDGHRFRRFEIYPLEPVQMNLHELYLQLRYNKVDGRRYYMSDTKQEVVYMEHNDRLYLKSRNGGKPKPWLLTTDVIFNQGHKFDIEVSL